MGTSAFLHCLYFDHRSLPVSWLFKPELSFLHGSLTFSASMLPFPEYRRTTSTTRPLRSHLWCSQIPRLTRFTSFRPPLSGTLALITPIWMPSMHLSPSMAVTPMPTSSSQSCMPLNKLSRSSTKTSRSLIWMLSRFTMSPY